MSSPLPTPTARHTPSLISACTQFAKDLKIPEWPSGVCENAWMASRQHKGLRRRSLPREDTDLERPTILVYSEPWGVSLGQRPSILKARWSLANWDELPSYPNPQT